jgi:hypothetical protein
MTGLAERCAERAERTRTLAKWQAMKRFWFMGDDLPRQLRWIREMRITDSETRLSRQPSTFRSDDE